MGHAPKPPIFYPSKADLLGSFESYVERIEKKVADVGICKIVAPKGWTPRRQGYAGFTTNANAGSKRVDICIPRPIRQHASGKTGLYRTILVEQKPMSLRFDFMPTATAPENQPPAVELEDDRHADLERRFWKNICLQPPLYGADVEGSLFDQDLKNWNLRKLPSLLSRTLEANGAAIPGVNTSYLYFGMWRSLFAWHTEDMDLASVNYLHYGASKTWYCISPAHRARFEQVVRNQLPSLFAACPQFFRHKELLVSPHLLERECIPVVRMVQHPGEFVITMPGVYHCGFNHGYNCAESTNFATRSWIKVGMHAEPCQCADDSVTIDMAMFLALAPARIRKELRQLIAARASAASSADVSTSGSDTATGSTSGACADSSEDDNAEYSGSAAHSAAESPAVSCVGGAVVRGRKRVAGVQPKAAPLMKRSRADRCPKKSSSLVSDQAGVRSIDADSDKAQASTLPAHIARAAEAAHRRRGRGEESPDCPAVSIGMPACRKATNPAQSFAAGEAGGLPSLQSSSPVVRSRPLRLAAAGVAKLVQALGSAR